MKKIGEIKEEFAAASEEQWNGLCQEYADDERSGVQKLIQQYQKKLANIQKEKLRMEEMMHYEHEYDIWDISAGSMRWEEARWQVL